MNSIVALPIAGALPIQSIAAADADPIFALIAAHQKAYEKLNAAERAHAVVERELQAAGDLFPSVTSRGNPYSGLPGPVSKTQADIDMYSPADLYPEDNRRDHDELSAAIARRDARHKPSQEAIDAAWEDEREALDRVVLAVPSNHGWGHGPAKTSARIVGCRRRHADGRLDRKLRLRGGRKGRC
ncbi:hypothetical protein GWE18_15115 [Bradyrhizobium sp. CSA112]|uniref:hypothetical protein n=1 Tax=Bradyrhizobium sp. CSA112 TaxID=2699170 RepID=UPI0023AF5EF2|nr:hypothetical protein [Bradyrhizobium sp. CSA112]MDE5454157.1 hypothetical protein [Bradyrhizobium sp. CSA112]